MSELLMMEAALFQLRAALGDDPMLLPIRISADVLGNSLAVAKASGLNAARVNDIEFALNDLVTSLDDADAPDAVYPSVALLQNDAAALRAATALPAETVNAIRDLQAKLRTRAKAMERAQYRAEGAAPEPLPYDADQLRIEAIPIVRDLRNAGFDIPSLASLVDGADELRYHTLNEVVDELDSVLGS